MVSSRPARTPHPSNVRFLLFRLLSITMTVSRVSGGCLLAAEQMVAGRTGEGVDSPMFIAGYSTPMIDATFWFWSPSALRRRPLCPCHPSRTPPHYTDHIHYCRTTRFSHAADFRSGRYFSSFHRASIVTLVKQEKFNNEIYFPIKLTIYNGMFRCRN